jgi:hypothetical protein
MAVNQERVGVALDCVAGTGTSGSEIRSPTQLIPSRHRRHASREFGRATSAGILRGGEDRSNSRPFVKEGLPAGGG